MGRNVTARRARDTLLSIDLDYWNTVTPTAVTFLKKVMSLKVPKVLTKHHQQVLPFVNRHKTKVLVNMDYHSDLCEDDKGGPPELDCGSWVNHVKWRREGTYIWVCPNKTNCYEYGGGRCDSERDASTDPFKNRNSGWKRTKVLSKVKHVNLSRVNAVAIAVSPDFLEWNESVWHGEKKRQTYFVRLKSIFQHFPFSWLEDVQSENSRTFSLN